MERASLISAGHDQSASWPQEVEQQLKILVPFSGRPAAFLLADHHAACNLQRLAGTLATMLNPMRCASCLCASFVASRNKPGTILRLGK